MTWTNAFSRGECAVEVLLLDGGGGSIFLQTMTAGDSASFSYGGVSYTVAVDSNGITSIDMGAEDTAPVNLCVLVEPAYDTSALVYRVADMHSAYSANWVRGVGSDIAVAADNSGVCTPDPVTSDFTGAISAGMIGASGYGNPRPLLSFDTQFDEASPQPPSIGCSGPVIEVWQPPSDNYQLRIRAYAQSKPFAEDDDTTTVDARLVFMLALANAKAHYRHPDANNYLNQLQVRLRKLRARSHNDQVYTPKKEWMPPPMPKILGIDD